MTTNGNGNGNGKIGQAVFNVLLVILAAILSALLGLMLDIRSDVKAINNDVKINAIKNAEQDGRLNENDNMHKQFRQDMIDLKRYHR